jgi:hypothetical protein
VRIENSIARAGSSILAGNFGGDGGELDGVQ